MFAGWSDERASNRQTVDGRLRLTARAVVVVGATRRNAPLEVLESGGALSVELDTRLKGRVTLGVSLDANELQCVGDTELDIE